MTLQNPEIYHYDELESTNHKLRELEHEKSLPDFSAVISNYQTQGRGQPGNYWESARDANLTFSFLLKPLFLQAQNQFRITQLVTLALTDWLSHYLSHVTIKWPNDIYAGDKKLGGILIENSLSGKYITSSIIGIGININQESFKTNPPNPASIKILTGLTYDVGKMFQECLKACIGRYLQWLETNNKETIEQEYTRRLYRGKGMHLYRDNRGEFKARFDTVEGDGHLVLITECGERRRYAFKEVTFVI